MANLTSSDMNCGGRSLFTEQTWQAIAGLLKLSPRELQIIQGIFDDRKELAIARDLGISPHTVNTYIQRLYGKLGVASRAQLIVCVFARYLALKTQDDTPTSE